MGVAKGVDVDNVCVCWRQEDVLECLKMSVSDLSPFEIQHKSRWDEERVIYRCDNMPCISKEQRNKNPEDVCR